MECTMIANHHRIPTKRLDSATNFLRRLISIPANCPVFVKSMTTEMLQSHRQRAQGIYSNSAIVVVTYLPKSSRTSEKYFCCHLDDCHFCLKYTTVVRQSETRVDWVGESFGMPLTGTLNVSSFRESDSNLRNNVASKPLVEHVPAV